MVIFSAHVVMVCIVLFFLLHVDALGCNNVLFSVNIFFNCMRFEFFTAVTVSAAIAGHVVC